MDQNRNLNKRDKVLQKLEEKSHISKLKQNILVSEEFRHLYTFCSQSFDHEFSSEIQKYIKQDPAQIIFNEFLTTMEPMAHNSKSLMHRIIYKLIEGLESNRVFPKLLGHTFIKNGEIKFTLRQESLIHELKLFIENQDFLLPIEDNRKMEGNQKIDQQYLILWNLEKLCPYINEYISPKYLNYIDILQIKETQRKLSDKQLKFGRISEIYNQIHQKIVKTGEQIWRSSLDSQDSFKGCFLKLLLKKKFGKFFLLNLCDRHIAVPQLLRQIDLLPQSEENQQFQESLVEIRFTRYFMNYLGKFKENDKIHQLQNKLERMAAWKSLKTFYYNTILQNFNDYENVSEEEAILLSLNEIYEQRNQYIKELTINLKNCLVARVIEEFQQKINYGIQKREEMTANQKWVVLIGEKLRLIQETVLISEERYSQDDKSQQRFHKRRDRAQASLEGTIQYFDISRTPSHLLKNQTSKFCYILKHYIIWMNQQGISEPFLLSLIKDNIGKLKVKLNYFSMETLVQNDNFIRFAYDVFHIELQGKSCDRVQQLVVMNQQDYFIEEYFYQEWVTVFLEQAKLIFDNRENIYPKIKKNLDNPKFFQLIQDIWTEGDSCQKRKQLKDVLREIQKFIRDKGQAKNK